MIIPAGKTAKLIRIKNPGDKDFRISEICDKLKFINAAPVIVLVGAMTQRAYHNFNIIKLYIVVKLWLVCVEPHLGLMLILLIQE